MQHCLSTGIPSRIQCGDITEAPHVPASLANCRYSKWEQISGFVHLIVQNKYKKIYK